jgi:uncharacterized membrane protein YedE/YeeE
MEQALSKRHWWMLAGIVAAAIAAYLVNPLQVKLLPPCLFHLTTGWHCPGCGASRALHQLAHGNLLTALSYNPLLVLMLPVLVYLLFRSPSGMFRDARWAWVLGGVVMLYWILRNLPIYPFTLLAP